MSVSEDIIAAVVKALDSEVIDVAEAPETAAFIAAIAAGVSAVVSPVLVQLVSAADSTEWTLSATSFEAKSAPSVTITAKRDNSRFRVSVRGLYVISLSSSTGQVFLSIARTVSGSTELNASGASSGLWGRSGTSSHGFIAASFGMVDEPGLPAGSEITYKISAFRESRDYTIGNANMKCELIVEEIA